jgi:mRNA interferase RelE/StbE
LAWAIEFTKDAQRQLRKLDRQTAARILAFLETRIAPSDNPRAIGAALQGETYGEFWKYRVGDYRIIARIEDARFVVLVVKVGDRKDVYRG